MANEYVTIERFAISHEEAAETLEAIRTGRVDAVVIQGATGEEVLTFRDPDHAYRALVEAMAEGAAIVTLEGIICYHNPRFVDLTTGSGGPALRGQAIRGLVPAEAAPSIDALLARAREHPSRIEVELVRPSGGPVPVQLTASPTLIGDRPVLCIVATDLAEQRAQQELYREALVGMERRERLLSIAGHELRSPLQSLTLHIDVLASQLEKLAATSEPAHDDLIKHIEPVKRQTHQLARLVDTLLDLGRVESDQLELDIEELDLAEVVRSAVDGCDELKRTGSAVTLDAHPVRGSWDRIRIEQVAANLVSNAAKYGLNKPIRIAVEGDDRSARIVVQDHGIGIAEDSVDRLFRPFERIGSVKAATGLGLGLYITTQIVKAHGGTVRVDSTPGVGSEFVVELPLARP